VAHHVHSCTHSTFTEGSLLLKLRLNRQSKTQLEIKLSYGLTDNVKKHSYFVKMYVFVPRVFALTSTNYPAERFYSDTSTFIRMSAPHLDLAHISKKKHIKPWSQEFKSQISRFSDGTGGDVKATEHSLKILGCVFKSSIRDKRIETVKNINEALDNNDQDQVRDSLQKFGTEVASSLKRIRKLGVLCEQDALPLNLQDCWRGVNEYTSLIAEESLTNIISTFKSIEAPHKTSIDPLKDLAISQYEHRKQYGFDTFLNDDDDNEYLPHRWRVLKRYISSALYLSVSRDEAGTLQTDLIAMFSAGLAMLFATLAILTIQSRWGVSMSMAFVSTMVIAYVVKDRIKELGKRHLENLLPTSLPDHKITVTDDSGTSIGMATESFTVVDAKEAPHPVRTLRFSDLESRPAIKGRPEHVWCYEKNIKLWPEALSAQFSGASGLTDIMRVNLESMLSRMDDAWEVYRHIHPETREVCETRCARMYHINIIFELGSETGEPTLIRSRLVMNKKGIQRIDTIHDVDDTPDFDTDDESVEQTGFYS
jgi:hypothetical protein